MQILIRNGQVVDPAAGTVQKADVLVEEGKILRRSRLRSGRRQPVCWRRKAVM